MRGRGERPRRRTQLCVAGGWARRGSTRAPSTRPRGRTTRTCAGGERGRGRGSRGGRGASRMARVHARREVAGSLATGRSGGVVGFSDRAARGRGDVMDYSKSPRGGGGGGAGRRGRTSLRGRTSIAPRARSSRRGTRARGRPAEMETRGRRSARRPPEGERARDGADISGRVPDGCEGGGAARSRATRDARGRARRSGGRRGASTRRARGSP